MNPDGAKDDSIPQDENLPAVQEEIDRLLLALADETGLRTLVAEGFPPGKDRLDRSKFGLTEAQWEFERMMMNLNPRQGFALKPKNSACGMLSMLYPEKFDVYGADPKDLLARVDVLYREYDRVKPPIESRTGPTPDPFALVETEQTAPITGELRTIFHKRSDLHLDAARELPTRDVAIVIGSWHIERMVERYADDRTLWVLRPKSHARPFALPKGIAPRAGHVAPDRP